MQQQFLLKLWKRYFVCTHIFSVLIAILYIICAVCAEVAEQSVLGDFEKSHPINITHTNAVLFYIIAGCLIISASVGVAAQIFPNRPGLWLLYCCLVTFLTVIEIVGAIAVLASLGVHQHARDQLKHFMEDYEDDDSSPAKKYFDKIHKKHECCGVNSYQDWQDVPYGRTTLRTPTSCCLKHKRSDELCSLNVLPDTKNLNKKIHTQGCMEVFNRKIDVTLYILGIVGILSAIAHCVRTYLVCYVVITRRF